MKRLFLPPPPSRAKAYAHSGVAVATPGDRIALEVRTGGLRLAPAALPVGLRPLDRAN